MVKCNFLHKMKVLRVDRNDHWVDIPIEDTAPNASKREWRFSYCTIDQSYYAVLYRATGRYEEFVYAVYLPKAMTEQLRLLVAPQLALLRLGGKI